jgi:cell division protease FtsH
MVTQYGMSERFGLMALSTVSNPYLDGSTAMNCADSTAASADAEIQSILASCYQEAKEVLRAHRQLLDEIALYLLQKETITGDELMAYVNADAKQITDGAAAPEASEAPEAPEAAQAAEAPETAPESPAPAQPAGGEAPGENN